MRDAGDMVLIVVGVPASAVSYPKTPIHRYQHQLPRAKRVFCHWRTSRLVLSVSRASSSCQTGFSASGVFSLEARTMYVHILFPLRTHPVRRLRLTIGGGAGIGMLSSLDASGMQAW
ncbi:hypothetical protein BU26DRAFT_67264 [Trematosphaeria pertusa]|uniref:Uncharacterized protein n=1 Tax=Trematosphaeria pertusa TaxID=390896 RepID=A0A6A6I544_9PLEO|nr:uncharacterized protein BU26DRAFT_67264 [Trematosphaeria pertusa]KAF2245349.1 hypothetical protein BU26DRAFT_67264 [Trematosphaeria pertusa]